MLNTLRARRWRRVVTTASLVTVGLLAGAGLASAHVSVTPSEAVAGDESVTLVFRVPNESATAGTVGVTIALPTDHPFADVAVKEVPGWTVTPSKTTLPAPVTEGNLTIKEAVTSVTWTAAQGTAIRPGEFAEFEVSAGPVPDVTALGFPTTQTYDDGTVVLWNEPTPPSGEEPEHPVPTLTVTPATGGDAGQPGSGAPESPGAPTAEASAGSTAGASTASGPSTASDSSPAAAGAAPGGQPTVTVAAAPTPSDSSSTPTILAGISIVLAAAALLVAAVALRRRPAGPTPPASPSATPPTTPGTSPGQEG